jgi:hypothetical protein
MSVGFDAFLGYPEELACTQTIAQVRKPLPQAWVKRLQSYCPQRGHNGSMDDPHAQPVREYATDLGPEGLDLLCENEQSTEFLAETPSQKDEQVGVDAIRVPRRVNLSERLDLDVNE